MDHHHPEDEGRTESPGFELEEIGRSLRRSSFRLPGSISGRRSSFGSAREGDDEYELQWAAIERLSTFERVRTSVLDPGGKDGGEQKKRVVDVTKLGALERRLLIEKLIKHIENDNLRLLAPPRNTQQDLFNMLGLMYVGMNFFGINNSSSVLQFVSTERTVLYRERYAGMYSPWAYSFAQMVIEIPYVFIQVGLFVVITYPAIGYYWSAQKFLWFFFTSFCTLLYFVYLGMLLVALTPNLQVASILQSPCYAVLNLFSGFMVPGPQIPKWWIWLYYITPMSWTLNGLFSSQYGDIDKKIMVFGERKSLASFLEDYFGFHHDRLGAVAAVLIAYPLIYGFLFAYCIAKLNFQRR